MKLFVGGLDYSATDQELEDFFSANGKVISAVVIKDKFTGQSKGFGFVEMEDIKDGQNAIKELDNKEFKGRAITVSQARPQEDRRQSNRSHGPTNNRRRY
jgi:RNA recognition motif-containing protein